MFLILPAVTAVSATVNPTGQLINVRQGSPSVTSSTSAFNTFVNGNSVEITGDTTNIRSTAGGSVLGQQAVGSTGTITGAAVFASGIANTNGWWWPVNFDAGVDGYVSDLFNGASRLVLSGGSGSNPWDVPTADTTIHMEAWTTADLQSAFASATTYHTSTPTGICKILAPAGTTTAALTSSITYSPIGPLILDYNGNKFSVASTQTLAFKSSYIWKQALSASVGVSSGNSTLTKSTNWSLLSPAPVAGDIGRVITNHRFYGDIGYSFRHGEMMEIASVSGTTVTLNGDLLYRAAASDVGGAAYTLTDAPYFCLLNSAPRVWLVDPDHTVAAGVATQCIRFTDLVRSYIINPKTRVDSTGMTAQNFTSAIALTGCYSCYVVNWDHADTAASSTVRGRYGYSGQMTQGKNNTCIRESGETMTISGTRGSFNTTASHNSGTTSTVTLANINTYGQEYNKTLDGLSVSDPNGGSAAYSQHSGVVGTVVRNYTGANTRASSNCVLHRGKTTTYQDCAFTSGSGTDGLMKQMVYAAYAPDWTEPSVPDGSWRDASDLIFQRNTCTVNGGVAWDFSPNAVTYSQAFNTSLLSNTWTINNTGNFDFAHCGDVLVSADTVNVVGNVSTLYSLTRPAAVTGTTQTSVVFSGVVVNLSGHANSGSMTVVSVGSNCTATGTITVINKPAGMTVTGKVGTAPNLTVTIS